jgi:hypothetical protein
MIAMPHVAVTSEKLEPRFVSKVLSCYFDHTTYLKDVSVIRRPRGGSRTDDADDIAASAMFRIDESCYIQSTGHFNAVEFNICFNQLAYVLYAHCFATGYFQEHWPAWGDLLSHFNPESFDKNQLSSMLIVNLSSKFKREIRGGQFYGELEIRKIRAKAGCVFTTNHIRFYDDEGGYSEGDVTLAFVAQR